MTVLPQSHCVGPLLRSTHATCVQSRQNFFRLYQFSAKPRIMKRRKLSEQHCNKIVQKYKLGTGYGRISRLLRIPKSTVRDVIQKWKRCGEFARELAADDTVRVCARTPSVSETARQNEERLDNDQKSGLRNKEQRIVPSQSGCGKSSLEHLNKGGRVQSAQRIHGCEIAGTVIAARGKKGWFAKDQNCFRS